MIAKQGCKEIYRCSQKEEGLIIFEKLSSSDAQGTRSETLLWGKIGDLYHPFETNRELKKYCNSRIGIIRGLDKMVMVPKRGGAYYFR